MKQRLHGWIALPGTRFKPKTIQPSSSCAASRPFVENIFENIFKHILPFFYFSKPHKLNFAFCSLSRFELLQINSVLKVSSFSFLSLSLSLTIFLSNPIRHKQPFWKAKDFSNRQFQAKLFSPTRKMILGNVVADSELGCPWLRGDAVKVAKLLAFL